VIWLKQMIHVAGAPAQTEFLLNGGSEDRRRRAIGSASFARFRAPDALIRFGCISPQSATRLSAIKSMAPTKKFYLRFIETGWTHELEQRLLLPRHALHSAKLAIEAHREWTSAIPPDLAEFSSGGL